MKRWLIPLLLLAVPVSATPARVPVPNDFVSGVRLSVPQGAAIYRVPLPQAAYQTATRNDLGDLRVFNASAEAVPHALRRPPIQEGTTPAPRLLPFYPFERLGKGGRDRVSIKVFTDNEGAVVDVGGGTAGHDGERIVSYLIDATGLKERPSMLSLDWSGTDVLHVAVEASDDLNLWYPLNKDATLVHLDYGGHRLERRRIPIPRRGYKYLRLAAPQGDQTFSVVSVEARFRKPVLAHNRNSIRVKGTPAEDNPNAWLFDTGGRMPIDRVELDLSQRNSLVSIVMRSRPDGKSKWLTRGNGVLYKLEVDGIELVDRTIDLSPLADRFWRLEIKSDPAGMGTDAPQLVFSWVPHELHFLARGEGPFLLAYGNADMEPSDAPIHSLLKRVGAEKAEGLIGIAEVTETVSLGGDARLKPSPPPFPWRAMLLWTVLLLGVLTLGWMAWRLFRQLSRSDSEHSER